MDHCDCSTHQTWLMRKHQPDNRLRYQKIGALPVAGQHACLLQLQYVLDCSTGSSCSTSIIRTSPSPGGAGSVRAQHQATSQLSLFLQCRKQRVQVTVQHKQGRLIRQLTGTSEVDVGARKPRDLSQNGVVEQPGATTTSTSTESHLIIYNELALDHKQ